MAKYRHIQTKVWEDPFFVTLTPEQKFFYLYLLTNGSTKQCGIYELTIRKAAYDTGYNEETINKLLGFFKGKKKVYYNKETFEICIVNFQKHNNTNSPKLKKCIQNEYKEIKDTLLIGYLNPINRVLQEEEKEEEKEEEGKKGKVEGKTPPLNYDKMNLLIYKNENDYSEQEKKDLINLIHTELKNSQIWLGDVSRATGLSSSETWHSVDSFIVALKPKGDFYKPLSDIRNHCLNTILKQKPVTNGR